MLRWRDAAYYGPAVVGGLTLGAGLLCVAFLGSPKTKAQIVFLLLGVGTGCVTTYICQRSSSLPLSLIKNTAIGSLVGLSAGIIYFGVSMVVFLIVANTNIVFNSRSLSLAVIGIVQLTVASGLGGLVAGLGSRLRTRMPSDQV
jgi:hypothetical protein